MKLTPRTTTTKPRHQPSQSIESKKKKGKKYVHSQRQKKNTHSLIHSHSIKRINLKSYKNKTKQIQIKMIAFMRIAN